MVGQVRALQSRATACNMKTDSAAARLPPQLLEATLARTRAVRQSLKEAMEKIDRELEANDGIYPQNKGRLTQAEVCRRANIGDKTLQGKAHKFTTLGEVSRWLAAKKAHSVHTVRSARRSQGEQVKALKAALLEMGTNYLADQLRAIDLEHRVAALESENAALRRKLELGDASKIRALPTKQTDS